MYLLHSILNLPLVIRRPHPLLQALCVAGCASAMSLFVLLPASAQTNTASPLTLYEVLDNASYFYPSLRAARFEARAATEDTKAVRLQRWPTATVTTESQTGNLRSYPTSVVQVQQTVWDFGRLSARIAEAEAAADVSLLNVYLQQQDLFLQIISAWQNMQAGRERVKVAESTLDRLKAYQAQMRRRVEAEASPRIDLELVDARLLQTEVELTTAKTSLQVAITRLEQLSGLERLQHRVNNASPIPSLKETLSFTSTVNATDWLYIASEGPLVAKARAQLRQAKNKLEGKKSEAWPQLYVRTYKPLSTIPSSTDTAMTAFVGLSYTPGAGLSTFAEAQALGTRLSGAQLSVESALLEMQQTLQSDREEYINSRLRIAALEKAVQGSELVLASYKRQFEAGKKTWLDLLNAVRELAQNQYSLADAQSTMLGAMARLQLRMGEHLQ
jgi:adhesin transport system outer membrane protein